jgi:hypothetical protein
MDDIARLKQFQAQPLDLDDVEETAREKLIALIAQSANAASARVGTSRRSRRPLDFGHGVRSRGAIALASALIVAIGAGASYGAVTLFLDSPSRTLVAITSANARTNGEHDGTSVGTVVGLPPLAPRVRAPGPTPTVAQCREAWSLDSSETTRSWLGGYSSSRASVRVETGSIKPGTAESTSYCSVQVLLGGGRELVARALFTSEGATVWSGSLLPLPVEVERLIAPRLDASVQSDGTISAG